MKAWQLRARDMRYLFHLWSTLKVLHAHPRLTGYSKWLTESINQKGLETNNLPLADRTTSRLNVDSEHLSSKTQQPNPPQTLDCEAKTRSAGRATPQYAKVILTNKDPLQHVNVTWGDVPKSGKVCWKPNSLRIFLPLLWRKTFCQNLCPEPHRTLPRILSWTSPKTARTFQNSPGTLAQTFGTTLPKTPQLEKQDDRRCDWHWNRDSNPQLHNKNCTVPEDFPYGTGCQIPTQSTVMRRSIGSQAAPLDGIPCMISTTPATRLHRPGTLFWSWLLRFMIVLFIPAQ